MIGIVLVGALIAGLIDPPKGPKNKQHSATQILGQAVTAAALAAGAFIALHSLGRRTSFALGLRRATTKRIVIRGRTIPATFVYFIAAAVIYALAANLVTLLANPAQDDIPKDLGYGASTVGDVAVIGLIVLGASISEEIFFRGFLFAGLRGTMSIVPAAIVSSALWASLHLGQADFAAAFQLFLFGLVLCWLYDRTGSLRQTILLHGLNNGLVVVYLLTR